MKIQNRAKICLCISIVIMLVAVVMSLTGHGINYGIDFAGGLNLQYDMGSTYDKADVEEALKAQGIEEFVVSTVGSEGTAVQIRVPTLSDEDEVQNLQNGLETTLLEKYPNMDTDNATASYVGPVAGATLVRNAIFSVLIAAVLMLIYIAFRFDLFSGIAAVAGLLHDVLIMISFMVILRNVIQMNSSFIAAMLTIVGYSINNTIVIRSEIVELSVKESLGRTINTTLTTLVTIVTLYILGVASIREFSLPIIIGILAGAYSANLINGYVWAALEDARLARKSQKKAA